MPVNYAPLYENSPIRDVSNRLDTFGLALQTRRQKEEEERLKMEEEKRQFEAIQANKIEEAARKARLDAQNAADDYVQRFTTIFDKVDEDNEGGKRQLIEAYNNSEYAKKGLIPKLPDTLVSYRKPVKPSQHEIDLNMARKVEEMTFFNQLPDDQKVIYNATPDMLSADEFNTQQQWKKDIELKALNRILDSKKTGSSTTIQNYMDDKKLNTKEIEAIGDEMRNSINSYNKSKQILEFIDRKDPITGKFAPIKNGILIYADEFGLAPQTVERAQSSEELKKLLGLTSLTSIKSLLSGPTSDRDIKVVKETTGDITDPEEILTYVFKQKTSDALRSMMVANAKDKYIRAGATPVEALRDTNEEFDFPLFAKSQTADGKFVTVDFNSFSSAFKAQHPEKRITDEQIVKAWKKYGKF